MANKIEIGDLVVNRRDYNKHIVLDIKLLRGQHLPSDGLGHRQKEIPSHLYKRIQKSGYMIQR